MPTLHSTEFSEQYRSFANDELLQLALTRQDLLPAAAAALEAELSARGLHEADVQTVRDQLRTPKEDEHPVSPEESPSQPTELPEDWFDEKPDEPTRSLAPNRPKGVTVCAYIFWLSAVVGAVFGGVMTVEAPFVGTVVIILSVPVFVTGCGLWRLRPWARELAVVLCWIAGAISMVGIAVDTLMKLRGVGLDDPMSVWFWAWNVIWNTLWALYLSSESTREGFVPKDQTPMRDTSEHSG
jgi:hypothetical protein